MKKRIYSQLMPCCKSLVIVLLGVLFATGANAQIIAFYPLTSSKAITGNTPSGQAWATQTNPNVTTGTASVGTNIAGSYNGEGIKIKTQGSDNSGNGIQTWPTAPLRDSFSLSLPLSPKAGNDIRLTGISFTVDSTGGGSAFGTSSTISVQPYYQVDGAGPWVPLGGTVGVNSTTPASTILTIPNVNNAFYSGHTYVVRFFFYSTNGATKADYITMDNVVFTGTTTAPPAIAPTVTLSTAIKTGKYTGAATGTYQSGPAYYLATQSGVVWGTSTNPTLATLFTTDGAGGVINGANASNITGLIPSTTYYVRAYIVTQFGITYSNQLSFITDPPSIPSVSIVLNSVLSVKANATGNVTDSGGLIISEKGFVWNKTGGATLASNSGKAYEGTGTQSFTDFVKGLSPNTHYCVRAYATNSLGTGYSADTCFTTGPPVPTLTAIPGIINFGSNFYNNSALILSYVLTGSNLNGTSITITAPPGFIIGKTAASIAGLTPGNTLTLTYSNGTLGATPIYVEMPTTAYGTFSGNIINSGGGTTAANADMVALTGSVVQSPIDVSNTGSDFWLGYAFEQKMEQKTSGGGANMYVYVSGAPGTVVTVEMPLLVPAFTTTVTIPASGFTSVTGFPQGDPNDQTNAAGFADARLYYTGVTNRGIHVYSHSGPISVWLYDYATNNSAGGALIFPTNTWNSNYTVEAYGNTSNTGPPNSFFFVIAQQDNTPVYFTPVVDVIDSTTSASFSGTGTDNAGNLKYTAGKTDTIYLNRGQIFNAMGAINSAGFGLDLSGTVVRTDCDKKIAVFGGNGRALVSTAVTCPNPSQGSDNMVQQMIPSVAWDTKYFTVPTKSMAHNLYRIYVHNTVTKVWVNDTTHQTASLIQNQPASFGVAYNGTGQYYTYESSYPTLFESDQPITVTQFMTSCSGNTAIGNNGSGDPEMIILTGAQQAINNATVFSPIFQDGSAGGAYINIVIPKAGTSTFKLDNAASVDTGTSSFTGAAYGAAALIPIANAFKPYPANPNYYYATFHVSYPAVHTMSSAIPFNGIAYGGANGESYGFNAGTAVKNLTSVQFANNPNGKDSSATAVRTCVGNSVTLQIALPFNPSLVDSLVWDPQHNPVINTPQGNGAIRGALSGGVAKYDSTITVNGRTFYVYSSPVQYTFNQLGNYRFPVTAYGTFASDCPGEDIENMLVIVGHDQENLGFQASCGSSTVIFTSDTIPMAGTNIVKWTWDFGDNVTQVGGKLDTVPHPYPPTGGSIYTAKLTTINSVGCTSTDSILVDFSGGLKAGFTTSTNAVCTGNGITFTDNTTTTGTSTGHPIRWKWDFLGDNGADTVIDNGTTSPHTFTYTTPGKYAARLTVFTDAGCIDIFVDTVIIEPTPVAAFTGSEACLGSATTFTDASTVPGGLGSVDSSFYDFGDGTKLDSLTAATVKHTYTTAGTYTATLYVKSDGGCVSAPVTQTVTVDALPLAGFKLDVNCATQSVMFTDTSNANGGTIAEWDWDFGDNTQLVTYHADTVFNHSYPNGNGKSFTVSLTVKTKAGCTNSAPPVSFAMGDAPVASFTVNPGTFCAPDASVTFTNTSTIVDGTVNQMGYIYTFGDGQDTVIAAPAGPPTTITHTYLGAATNYTVTLIAQSNKGCTNTSLPATVTVHPQPIATISPNPASDCLSDSLQLSGSAAAVQWNWNFGDGVGTNTTAQNPKYKWNSSGKYVVSLLTTSSFGCVSDSAIDSVTVNDLPVANFTVQSLPLCASNSISFTDASTTPTGSTVNQWTWDFGDGSPVTAANSLQNPTHTYAVANTYTVTLTVKNTNGCSSIIYSAPVTVHPLPVVNFSVAPICLPGAAQFTDLSTVADGSGIGQYLWDFGDGATVPGGPTNSHVYATGGIYPVKLTVTSSNGCSNDTTINDTAHNVPIAKDSILNDTALCSNKLVTLIDESSVTGESVSKINIIWDYLNPSIDTTINNPVPNASYTHQYPALPTDNNYGIVITAYSGNGCPPNAPDTTLITVHGSPDAQFAPIVPNPVCQETAPFALSTGSDISGLAGSGSYSGQGVGIDSVTFSPAEAGPGGPYQIVYTYTSNNGCYDTAMAPITVYPTPIVNYGPTKSVLEGDSLVLDPIDPNLDLHYMWTPSLYLNNDTLPSPLCKPVNDITYTIMVKSPGGCQATTTLLVQVLRDFVVPNTFTPNSDGINDTWVIENLPKYPIQWVQVFDRYGQLLFESHGYSNPWDGTYKGKPVASGTYYYIIEVNGLQQPKTGYVTILR